MIEQKRGDHNGRRVGSIEDKTIALRPIMKDIGNDEWECIGYEEV